MYKSIILSGIHGVKMLRLPASLVVNLYCFQSLSTVFTKLSFHFDSQDAGKKLNYTPIFFFFPVLINDSICCVSRVVIVLVAETMNIMHGKFVKCEKSKEKTTTYHC